MLKSSLLNTAVIGHPIHTLEHQAEGFTIRSSTTIGGPDARYRIDEDNLNVFILPELVNQLPPETLQQLTNDAIALINPVLYGNDELIAEVDQAIKNGTSLELCKTKLAEYCANLEENTRPHVVVINELKNTKVTYLNDEDDEIEDPRREKMLKNAGTTFIAVAIIQEQYYIFNIGDPTVILINNDATILNKERSVINLREAFKTASAEERNNLDNTDIKEYLRIKPSLSKKGIYQISEVSRSLGDFGYITAAGISPEPELYGPFPLNQDDIIAILCDGVTENKNENFYKELPHIRAEDGNLDIEAVIKITTTYNPSFGSASRDNVSGIAIKLQQQNKQKQHQPIFAVLADGHSIDKKLQLGAAASWVAIETFKHTLNHVLTKYAQNVLNKAITAEVKEAPQQKQIIATQPVIDESAIMAVDPSSRSSAQAEEVPIEAALSKLRISQQVASSMSQMLAESKGASAPASSAEVDNEVRPALSN